MQIPVMLVPVGKVKMVLSLLEVIMWCAREADER